MTKAIIDLVISLNGMIARENGDEDWLPQDGWDAFLQQVYKYKNVVVGRETYEIVKEKYQEDNFDAIKGVLKIIVTRNSNYAAPDESYVVAHSPEEAIRLVEEHGLEYAYVGGGGKLAGSFLRAKLVEGLHLTVLPKIIPKGRPFIGNEDFADVELELLKSEAHDGKVVLDYKVY